MAFDMEMQNTDALWEVFSAAACKPYAGNAERHAGMQNWFQDLYARRKDEGIHLTHHLVEARLPKGLQGRRFNAFGLGDAEGPTLFVSDNPGVLSMPHVRGSGRPERRVGLWLNNFETPEKEIDLYRAYIDQGGTDFMFIDDHNTPPHARYVMEHLHAAFDYDDLPDYDLGMFEAKRYHAFQQFRLQKDVQREIGVWHRDGYLEKHQPAFWARILLHSIMGKGTVYRIGANEQIEIAAPTGTTASIIGANTISPCEHRGQSDPDGRAVLVLGSAISLLPDADTLMREPWRITPAAPIFSPV